MERVTDEPYLSGCLEGICSIVGWDEIPASLQFRVLGLLHPSLCMVHAPMLDFMPAIGHHPSLVGARK